MTQQLDKTSQAFGSGDPTDINMRWANPVPMVEDLTGARGIGGYGSDLFRDDWRADLPGIYGALGRPLLGTSYTGKPLESVGGVLEEMAYALAPGAASVIGKKVLPAAMAEEGEQVYTPRGEPITVGQALPHLAGIRLAEPQEGLVAESAENSLNLRLAELKRRLQREVTENMDNEKAVDEAQNKYIRDVQSAIMRYQYLMGENKSDNPSYFSN